MPKMVVLCIMCQIVLYIVVLFLSVKCSRTLAVRHNRVQNIPKICLNGLNGAILHRVPV